MTKAIADYLMANWQGAFGEKPDELLFIKTEDRHIRAAEVGTVTFIIKGKKGGREYPVMVVRTPRYPGRAEAEETLALEYGNLEFIQQKLKGSPLIKTVPAPLFQAAINGAQTIGFSFLSGQDQGELITAADLAAGFYKNYQIAINWLIDFEKGLGCPAQHRDFHAANIFIKNDAVSGVIDWEDLSPAASPGFDAVHYISTYFMALYNYGAKKHDLQFIAGISNNSELLASLDRKLEEYARAVGNDEKVAKLFVPQYLSGMIELAGSPRKQVVESVRQLQIIQKLKPVKMSDLVFFASAIPIGTIFNRAKGEGDTATMEKAKAAIMSIQKRSAELQG